MIIFHLSAFTSIMCLLMYQISKALSAQDCTELKPAVANFAAVFIHQEIAWQICVVFFKKYLGQKG
jgi:hypothetical protein